MHDAFDQIPPRKLKESEHADYGKKPRDDVVQETRMAESKAYCTTLQPLIDYEAGAMHTRRIRYRILDGW